MKEFVKIGNALLRTSAIRSVWYENPCSEIGYNYAIHVDIFDDNGRCYFYDTEEEFNRAKMKLEIVLLDEEEPAKPPKDYDAMLNSIKKIYAYYGCKTLSAHKIRWAVWNLEGVDRCGYGIPDFYAKVAVEYGILKKKTPQSFELIAG